VTAAVSPSSLPQSSTGRFEVSIAEQQHPEGDALYHIRITSLSFWTPLGTASDAVACGCGYCTQGRGG